MPHRSSSAPSICTACCGVNEPGRATCGGCGAQLTRIEQSAGPLLPGDGNLNDVQAADLELCLADLTARIHAAEAARTAISEMLARREGTAWVPAPARPAARGLQIDAVRLTITDEEGARLETSGGAPSLAQPALRLEADITVPVVDVRQGGQNAVWEALAAGAAVVRIDGPPGAGATTLLHLLAARAHEHDFPAGALLLDAVRGPAADMSQRVAAYFYDTKTPRFYAATDLSRDLVDVRALVLFDRAKLTADELRELHDVFPAFRFVVAGANELDHAPSITLGPLHRDGVIRLLEQSCGRRIDEDNRRVGLELCESAGSLPGPTRLIGIAARESGRSLISLGLEFQTGEAIIRASIANLSPLEQRILGCLALAGIPLSAADVQAIIVSGDADAALEHLTRCELLRFEATGLYAIPRYVERLTPALTDADSVGERIVAVACGALDRMAAELPACGWASVEALVTRAFEQAQWRQVIALGQPLADACALNGLFGAWKRVLELVEAAAARLNDIAARDRANHDLRVRAELAGGLADKWLDGADTPPGPGGGLGPGAGTGPDFVTGQDYVTGPDSVTESPGAGPAPSDALAPAGSANSGRRSKPSRNRNSIASRDRRSPPRASITPTLQLLLVCTLAIALIALALGRKNRPSSPPSIAQFTSSPRSLTSGAAAQLCLEASGAAVVEVFPDAARLPGTGKHCLVVHPAATTTYIAVATSADGRQARDAVTVRITPKPLARRLFITSFSANPAQITPGGSTQICYDVSGAKLLRIVPLIGDLTLLRSCREIILRDADRYTFQLSATGDNGHVATRELRVDVVPLPSPSPVQAASSGAAGQASGDAAGQDATREAVYQFDATPSVVERGQSTSLCAGVERPARGFVTSIGSLTPGITRCYRVQPRSTTVYRLYVTLEHSKAVEAVTVFVRPPARRSVAARFAHSQ